MAVTLIPEGGLVLPPPPAKPASGEGINLPQIIQLDLENGMLFEMMRAARKDGRNPQLSFGRTVTLHYGSKTRSLSSMPTTTPSFLYNRCTDQESHPSLAGRFTHKLEMQKAQEGLTGNDEAEAQLQNSLAAAEQAKQAHHIKYVPDSSGLPPAKKQTAASLKLKRAKNNSLAFLKKTNLHPQSKDSVTRSLPSSPAMAPVHPAVFTLTQANELQMREGRARAIRKPLLHLLAYRPMSTNYLSRELKCKEGDLQEFLSKLAISSKVYSGKWELKDLAYKELDVWSFPYKHPEDRQEVIQHAVTAFDRKRIPPMDECFQRLLPKGERNKGKSLSKLANLNKGPINPNSTPKIHVQLPGQAGKDSEQERSRDTQNDTAKTDPPAPSKAHESPRKTKRSEKEAQSKRLLAKGQAKASQAPKTSQAQTTVNKGVKKTSAPLSAEFVHNSDDEDGLDPVQRPSPPKPEGEAQTTKSRKAIAKDSKPSKPKPASQTASSESIVHSASKTDFKTRKELAAGNTADKGGGCPGMSIKKDTKQAQKAPDDRAEGPTSGPKRKAADPSPGDVHVTKRPRNGSSPHKPSPLGSSPPTNASEIGHEDLSTSPSTPLVATTKVKKPPVTAAVNGHARNTSVQPPKPKAIEIDRNATKKSHLNSPANGITKAAKRPSRELTPPSSDSPSPPSKSARVLAIEKAERFRHELYPKYQRFHMELLAMASPPAEKVEKLEKMRERCIELKKEIAEDFARTQELD